MGILRIVTAPARAVGRVASWPLRAAGKQIGRGAVEGAVDEARKEIDEMAAKPGHKTTEFWITMLSQVFAGGLGALLASGAVDPSSTAGAIIAAVAAMLSGGTAANYARERTKAKGGKD